MKLDNELKGMAIVAIKNSFFTELTHLINAHMEAAAGLDLDVHELLETHSFGDDSGRGDVFINIWVKWPSGGTCGCDSLTEALDLDNAVEVHMHGVKLFVRDAAGEWVAP